MKNRIKELREKNNLTLKGLGKKVGLADNTLSQYETGKRHPKFEVWQKLADFFGVSVPYLQGYVEINIPNDLKFDSKQDAEDQKIREIVDGKKDPTKKKDPFDGIKS